MVHNENECSQILANYGGQTQLAPTTFKLYFFLTLEFNSWWHKYYSKEFLGVEGFTKHLTRAFSFVQDKIKKGKFTHIKEIQAFQKYFETTYRPNDLGRTIREAAVTLKEKFTKKLGSLKFPSYVKIEQHYEIDFNLYPPTFP